MASVVQTVQSRADVIEIDVYIRRHNPAAADRVLAAIDATFGVLANAPMAGRSREELAPNLRSLSVTGFNAYLVFYRPQDDGIAVIRVLRGTRDLPEQLAGL